MRAARDLPQTAVLCIAGALISIAACGRSPATEPSPSPRGTVPTAAATIALPTAESIASSTRAATVPPSTTPTATPTPTTTLIPVRSGSLNRNGPWLVGVDGEDRLFALDSDGSGLTALAHQPLWGTYPYIGRGIQVSSTGWIAVRTSSARWPDPPTDFAIELFHLPEVEPVRRIFPFSEQLVAEMDDIGLHEQPHDSPQIEGPNWRHALVYMIVLAERNPPLWSPDGRYLAFSAAMDGPSADLYVYDTRTDEVQRLTDGPNQAALMGWSPDSRWIVHTESTSYMIADGGTIGGFPADAVWAAAADGSEVTRLYGPAGVDLIAGWTSNTNFVVERWSGYIFEHDLREVDLATGAERAVYPNTYYGGTVLAPEARVAVVDAPSEWLSDEEYFPGGLTLVGLDGSEPRQLHQGQETRNARWLAWYPQLGQFLASGYGTAYLFTPSGEITHTFENEQGWPSVSPDGEWLVFDRAGERPGVRLYSTDGDFEREISQEAARVFLWTGDSASLYYLSRGEGAYRLMRVAIPDGEPFQVHPHLPTSQLALIEADPKGP